LTPQESAKESIVNDFEKEKSFEDDDAMVYMRAK
jgi:hypothetical protein